MILIRSIWCWLKQRIRCLISGHDMTRRCLLTLTGGPVTIDHCVACGKAKRVIFERG